MLCATPGTWVSGRRPASLSRSARSSLSAMSQPGDHEPSAGAPGGHEGLRRAPGPGATQAPNTPPDPRWSPPTGPADRALKKRSGAGQPAVGVPDNVAFLDVPGAPPATRADASMWLLFAAIGYLVGQIVGLVIIYVVAAAL